MLPFVLLGIGIDDTFVLMQGLALYPPCTKVRFRVRVRVRLRLRLRLRVRVSLTLTLTLNPSPNPNPNPNKSGVQMSVPERMANTLAHAGASIMVTSLTDITAFVLGTTSSLPG